MANTRVFGHIPGVRVGATFANRRALSDAGVHGPTQAGISGSAADGGADSIVVSGGYEDDRDYGDEIIYTGHGGRDPKTGRQVADQELTRQNLALCRNLSTGHPVRVVRGANAVSTHAPASGYRYDGLYVVDDCWQDRGQAGFRIVRFRLHSVENEPDQAVASVGELPKGDRRPSRRRGSISRVIRDTRVSREVKLLHEHKCQVCGTVLSTPGGRYAQAAHIQPLGEPHNGPDVPENVLCLCPNHHVLFDLGAFSINDDLTFIGIDGRLLTRSGHEIGQEYLTYHREHYGFV